MINIQNAIIARVKEATNSDGALIFDANSVGAYTNEISKKGIETSKKLPAALVMFRSGEYKEGKFDVLVITESQSFDKQTNMNNNLNQSSELLNYFSNYPGWDYEAKPYVIDESEQKSQIGLVMQSGRHTVIGVSIYVKKLS